MRHGITPGKALAGRAGAVAMPLVIDPYRTIVTIGCPESSRYSASSCPREVALTVQVSER